jgi:superfamily I DNA/RNA helicase/mRNA-degrading endonuclease RelE of RelBE toxin-antitoxin system
MNFLIADTFTASLARLTGEEQKAVKTTVFDLQVNRALPSLQLHKLDKARDKNFWSARVNSDIRVIVHRSENSLLVCYVDHHDKAYDWAERRRLETHPKTGAAQIVEIRETVREIVIPVHVAQLVAQREKPLPFARLSDEELLSYGVPVEWLTDVRAANEDSILAIAERLPAEAAEALLEIATGGTPPKRQPAAQDVTPFEHPDAQRRFRVMENIEDLERALAFPWDRWTVFLHPAQRELVERDFAGPARVSGSAGTGKTIVALHRAVHIARANPDGRVLLATFSDTLAHALHDKLRRLIGSDPRLADRIDVASLDSVGQRLFRANSGPLKLATDADLDAALAEASGEGLGNRFGATFLRSEWTHVVDAWQLTTWESYRDVTRLGRKTRLTESQREVVWRALEKVWQKLDSRNVLTRSAMFTKLASILGDAKHPPYDFAVIDEAQDVSVAHLRFLAAMGANRRNALFFAGDLGQRIFQQPFSWKSLGVDVRGRSRNLTVNYRTSHQIRSHADRLLGPEVTDADGLAESRVGTVSVFNGVAPEVITVGDVDTEATAVAQWLRARRADGVAPHETAVFVRAPAQLERARKAMVLAEMHCKVLDDRVDTTSGLASISTMHLAKGLEFRAVAVMACDDDVLPLQERIESVGDEADLKEVYETERHLLYVACTRARDYLLVTSVEPASEFLDDLRERRPRWPK